MTSKLMLDPRIDVDGDAQFIIQRGGLDYRFYQETSRNISQSSASFNIVPPSKDIFVDPRIRLRPSVTFNLTRTAPDITTLPVFNIGANPAANPPLAGTNYLCSPNESLRHLPLQSCTESVSMTMNQSTVTLNVMDVVDAMSRYGIDRSLENGILSAGCMLPDAYQDYSDFRESGYPLAPVQGGWGGNRNPLGRYGDSSDRVPRGSLQYVVANNASANVEVKVTWEEDLILSPLVIGRLRKGFLNLTNLDLTLNFSNLARMWCSDGSRQYNVTANLTRLDLCLTYITPPIMLHPLPSINRYNYYNVTRYVTDVGTVEIGAEGSQLTNNVQLGSVPQRIYIYVRPKVQTQQPWLQSDSYLGITKLELNWCNKSALLSSGTDTDLYRMSRENGYQDSYQAFSFFNGSVCCVDFSKDVGLENDTAVGMMGQYSTSFKVYFKNLARFVRNNVGIYMVVVQEGMFIIEDSGNTQVKVGNVDVKSLFESARYKDLDRITYEDMQSMYGGSIWSTIRGWGRRLSPYLQKGISLAKQWGPKILRGAEYLAPLLAAGYDSQEIQSIYDGTHDGSAPRKRMKKKGSGVTAAGAGIVGGKAIKQRSKLKKRIML